jgi:hypothetical protein
MWTYNKEPKDKKWIAVISVLAVNLLASAFIIIYLFMPSGSDGGGTLSFESTQNGQYILYIGTNDRDTYEQIIQTDEAVEIVNGICAKHVEGYTMSHAKGGWVDEKGVLTQENTLVYTFAYADESDVAAIMDEILTALNQNSILVERRDISSVFYYGKDNGQ